MGDRVPVEGCFEGGLVLEGIEGGGVADFWRFGIGGGGIIWRACDSADVTTTLREGGGTRFCDLMDGEDP